MMRRILTAVVLTLSLTAIARAQDSAKTLRLPNCFSDNMVLQRDMPVPVWGWDAPGAKVTVAFAAQKQTATTDKDGKWTLTLKPLKTSKTPGTLFVSSSANNGKLEIGNILVGEVWLASGQSNMEWPLQAAQGGQEAIADADIPEIRLLHVPRTQVAQPADDVNATWKVCTPKTVPGFSAVAYFFGRKLNHELQVPVGLINASWGGSPIQPWTPAAGYDAVEAFKTIQNTGKPTMYNGMIAPLVPMAVRGTIWYQGESNMGGAPTYGPRMLALIRGWRKDFGKDMAFGLVELAPYSRYARGSLPIMWEQQTGILSEPGTGIVVVTDLVSNLNDIHPRNKVDVGERLALWALAKSYGQKKTVYSGPMYKAMKIKGSTAVLTFDHLGGGLKTRDDKPLTHFEIAAEDGTFVPAQAEIDGKTVVVSAEGIEKPTAVRFAWSNTARPNFCNAQGLPAVPFRTNRPE